MYGGSVDRLGCFGFFKKKFSAVVRYRFWICQNIVIVVWFAIIRPLLKLAAMKVIFYDIVSSPKEGMVTFFSANYIRYEERPS